MALMLEVQLTEADKRCSSLCSRLHRGEHREGSQTARRGAAYTGGDRPRRTVLSTGNSTETQVQTFFTVRVLKHRHRLLREDVESPSLEILVTQLGMVLGNLLQLTLP